MLWLQDTLLPIVAESSFSLLHLDKYLHVLSLTTLISFTHRCGNEDFSFTSSSGHLSITKHGVSLVTFALLDVAMIYYCPQRSWGKVIFLQASVILLTGGCLPQCMLGYHPPPGSRHPHEQTPPEQTLPPRADTSRHRACWEIWSMLGGTHPTGMQSC